MPVIREVYSTCFCIVVFCLQFGTGWGGLRSRGDEWGWGSQKSTSEPGDPGLRPTTTAHVLAKIGRISIGTMENDLEGVVEARRGGVTSWDGGHRVNFRAGRPNTQKRQFALKTCATLKDEWA
jgi:hypothetical protein